MKKEIPIALRKIIDEVYLTNPELFNIIFGDDYVAKIQDSDTESDYYFQVTKVNPPTNGKSSYLIDYKPLSEESNTNHRATVDLKSFRVHFDIWSNNLLESNKPSPLFDDLIAQSYYDEIAPKFTIIDEDAHIRPFSISQQKELASVYNEIKEMIENYKTDDASEKLEILNLIEEATIEMSKNTKFNTVNKFQKIIAKTFKMGAAIGEQLLLTYVVGKLSKLLLPE